jgi:hypothetical protein
MMDRFNDILTLIRGGLMINDFCGQTILCEQTVKVTKNSEIRATAQVQRKIHFTFCGSLVSLAKKKKYLSKVQQNWL